MARKSHRASVSSYFRELFSSHPELLDEKSNDILLDRYRKDHGLASGAELPATIKNNLANMKSVMRKRLLKSPPAVRDARRLQSLEEMIDECLMAARDIDADELKAIIHLLRRARNEVVLKLGQ